ncbi:serine carboxypeptidase-like 45 isoform X2 [Cornus florida]|uniref:serine carboxypeptidase-like 45 isoform X2 n=1 Tax=Cornus florida TaxID=4283 RepID=UPI0028A14219|nr:serine carboxypeptidase-like 45 isoform X2 [Cornus florida]
MAFWMLLAVAALFLFYISRGCGELVAALPGQPANVSFKQYSGYIVTDAKHGRALFYYFVEAQSADHLSRPLTLWLNGGPGCSSLGFGAFMENGPFQVGENGLLVKNEHSWNLESNMLYVESPIGVGFSYSNTSEDYINWNDTRTAEDNLVFMINWLEEFPKFKDSDFFITGESYAGHYIPQLAALLLDYNKKPNVKPIKLKALALGNPLLDLDISIQAGDYLWSHGAISDETLRLEKTVCNDSRHFREYYRDGQLSPGCKNVFNRVEDEIGDVSFYDLLSPNCLSSSSAQQFQPKGLHGNIHAMIARRGMAGDPCLPDRILTYLNTPIVQKSLHANTTHLPSQWGFCLGPLVYQKDNLDRNLTPLITDLLKEGIPILLFSGDQDSRIPLTQTRTIANNIAKDLKLVTLTKYGPWYDKKQVGGWYESFGGLRDGKNVTYLTFATVRGAAHEKWPLYSYFTFQGVVVNLYQHFQANQPMFRLSSTQDI